MKNLKSILIFSFTSIVFFFNIASINKVLAAVPCCNSSQTSGQACTISGQLGPQAGICRPAQTTDEVLSCGQGLVCDTNPNATAPPPQPIGGTFTCSCQKVNNQHVCQVAPGLPVNCTGGARPNTSVCTTSPLGQSPCGVENQSSYFCTLNCAPPGGVKKQCETCTNTSDCEAGLECFAARCIKKAGSLGLGGTCCIATECGTYKSPNSGDVLLQCLKPGNKTDFDLGTCSPPDKLPPSPYSLLCSAKKDNDGINTAVGCIPFDDIVNLASAILVRGAALAGGISFLLILAGGFQLLTSRGDPEKVIAGKQFITSAIGGLALTIFAIFVLRLIGVDILGVITK